MSLDLVLSSPGLASQLLHSLGPVAAHRLLIAAPAARCCDFPQGIWRAPENGAKLAMELLNCTEASELCTGEGNELFLNKLFVLTHSEGSSPPTQQSLLDIAVERRLGSAIKLLRMRGQVLSWLSFYDDLSFEFYVQNDDIYMVRLYLEAGVPVDTTCDGGRTPLMLAAAFHSRHVSKLLLEWGAGVNCRSLFGGWTALMWAAHAGCEECLKLLLAAGARMDEKNTQGLTAGAIACRQGHLGILQILQRSG